MALYCWTGNGKEVCEAIRKRPMKLNNSSYTLEVEEIAESSTVLVKNVPSNITEDTLFYHFENNNNGGGEVYQRGIKLLPEHQSALVPFEKASG